MAIQKKRLRALPNPWQYIDHLGRPAGVCPCDPNEHTPDRRWVGASIDTAVEVRPARVLRIGGQSYTQREASHDITWKFADEPTEIPNTAYYRQRIAGGELIAADVETAEACGISRADFVDPKALLAKLKDAAIVQFDAENGDDAFDQLNADLDEKRAAAEAAEEALKPPKPAAAAKPVAPKADDK